MSKFATPTSEEIRTYPLNPEIVRYLERYGATRGVPREAVRTLDYGCGRGQAVARLRQAGYDAMGADISDTALEFGTQYFVEAGDPNALQRLHRIGEDGRLRTAEPASFDYIYSQTVLEHVEDLDTVARELSRLLKPGGWSFHAFPAQYHIVEEHMGMPFVHWLPKNRLREWCVRFWMFWGREPRWGNEPYAERVQRYVRYVNRHTFYRSPQAIRKAFDAAGLNVSFVSGEHPRVTGHPLLGRLRRLPGIRRCIDWAVTRFTIVEVLVIKPAVAPQTASPELAEQSLNRVS